MCVNKIQKLFKLVLFMLLSPFWEMAKFAHLATLKNLETGIHASLDSNCHYFQNLQQFFSLCDKYFLNILHLLQLHLQLQQLPHLQLHHEGCLVSNRFEALLQKLQST